VHATERDRGARESARRNRTAADAPATWPASRSRRGGSGLRPDLAVGRSSHLPGLAIEVAAPRRPGPAIARRSGVGSHRPLRAGRTIGAPARASQRPCPRTYGPGADSCPRVTHHRGQPVDTCNADVTSVRRSTPLAEAASSGAARRWAVGGGVRAAPCTTCAGPAAGEAAGDSPGLPARVDACAGRHVVHDPPHAVRQADAPRASPRVSPSAPLRVSTAKGRARRGIDPQQAPAPAEVPIRPGAVPRLRPVRRLPSRISNASPQSSGSNCPRPGRTPARPGNATEVANASSAGDQRRAEQLLREGGRVAQRPVDALGGPTDEAAVPEIEWRQDLGREHVPDRRDAARVARAPAPVDLVGGRPGTGPRGPRRDRGLG